MVLFSIIIFRSQHLTILAPIKGLGGIDNAYKILMFADFYFFRRFNRFANHDFDFGTSTFFTSFKRVMAFTETSNALLIAEICDNSVFCSLDKEFTLLSNSGSFKSNFSASWSAEIMRD